jgi:Zn-dependent peptidase ImmA (M78 family)
VLAEVLGERLVRGRAWFTEAHELGHCVVPWHREAYVDDERTLFSDTELVLELEANLAAHLIFQGRPFFERALDYPLSLRTPLLAGSVSTRKLHKRLHTTARSAKSKSA